MGFAPQALGETTPTLSNGYFYASQGMALLNKFATYAALYSAQPAIATLVDKIANAAARLSVKSWDVTPASGRVQDKSSDYAKLLASPCTEMSPFAFWRWTVSTYEVFGEAFWYKQRAGKTGLGLPAGAVVNLLPMHPSRVAVHRTDAGAVEYIFTLGVASAGLLVAPAEDVVPFLRYNPENLMRGLSRLEPLRSTLLNEDASRRANSSYWKRGARPSLVLEHPGELGEVAIDRVKARFDATQSGADNMGGTAVLQEGMKANVIQLSAVEMQFIESRKMNLQEACMVFDVPPPVVHILDHATFSNITEQMRSMYRDTMSPRLEDLESTIDHYLLPEFFSPGQRETEFDMTEVLRGDFETRADKAVTLRQSGIITGNQALEIVGMPRSDDPEMDLLFANAALVPLGSNAQPAPAPVAEPVTVVARAVSHRSIMGRLGRLSKAPAKDVRAALVAEHKTALAKFFDEQRAAVERASGAKAPGVFDAEAWDADLSQILLTLAGATAQAIGEKVAAELGGKYSSDDIRAWMQDNADSTARSINQTTKDEILAALDRGEAATAPFDTEIAARADQISLTRVAVVGGLAALVAARLSNAKTKTWVVTSGNPRPSHAGMAGETVPLRQVFSNGMNGPGDYSGGAGEVAGCTCELVFNKERA